LNRKFFVPFALTILMMLLVGCFPLQSQNQEEDAENSSSTFLGENLAEYFLGLESNKQKGCVVGIVGSHIVAVNPVTAAISLLGSTAPYTFSNLTYDKKRKLLYTIHNFTTDPKLAVIDLKNGGRVEIVGSFDTSVDNFRVAEGIAYDNAKKVLYASAGKRPNYSDFLVKVDIKTGNATIISRVSGTVQSELDSITFAKGHLLGIDLEGNKSNTKTQVYKVNTHTAEASFIGATGLRYVPDITYYPSGKEMIAATNPVTTKHEIASISPKDGKSEVIGRYSTSDFNGKRMLGVTWINKNCTKIKRWLSKK